MTIIQACLQTIFKFARFDLCIHISCLLCGMLVHDTVPDDSVSSTTVPIPKGSNVDLTVSDNYRGITLLFLVKGLT